METGAISRLSASHVGLYPGFVGKCHAGGSQHSMDVGKSGFKSFNLTFTITQKMEMKTGTAVLSLPVVSKFVPSVT